MSVSLSDPPLGSLISSLLSAPVKCLSTSFQFLPLHDWMQFFKWLGKRHFVIYDTKSPTPSANPPPPRAHPYDSASGLPPQPPKPPLAPKTLLANRLFLLFVT